MENEAAVRSENIYVLDRNLGQECSSSDCDFPFGALAFDFSTSETSDKCALLSSLCVSLIFKADKHWVEQSCDLEANIIKILAM